MFNSALVVNKVYKVFSILHSVLYLYTFILLYNDNIVCTLLFYTEYN